MDERTGCYALAVFKKTQQLLATSQHPPTPSRTSPLVPPPSPARLAASLQEHPYNLATLPPNTLNHLTTNPEKPQTILYLAYGSNLSASTFLGRRGIRPISQINVVVPSLVMTFDLAGLPYVEPCFANTRYRSTSPTLQPSQSQSLDPEKAQLLRSKCDYHKTRWHKGLVGVVYEVTLSDFAHIIATEGGGASYQNVLVSCYELPPSGTTVPAHPASPPFKAHTLYSPISPPGRKPPEKGGRFSRPDPNYAQPSARYLKLINDGADEHGLPEEYKTYLRQLRAYRVTSRRQELGRWIFMMIWVPFVTLVFSLNKRFADEEGKAPGWLVVITGAIFRGMWDYYDGVFLGVFGDGERTVGEGGDDGEEDGVEGLRRGRSEMRYRDDDDDDEKAGDVYHEV